jgi:hypothetical protein
MRPDRQAPRDPAQKSEASVQERIDRWFTLRGVPTFADSYPFSKLLPVVMAPLFVVAIAQLGSAPVVELETWHIAVGPLVVTLLALPLLPTLRWALDPGRPEDRPKMSGSPALLAFAAAAVLILFMVGTEEGADSLLEAVVNGIVLIVAAVVAWLVGVHRDARAEDENTPDLIHWILLAVGIAAVVLFALEDMPIEPLDRPTLGVLPEQMPAALPVLVILIPLWLASRRIARKGASYDPRRVADCQRRDALISLSPILIFTLGPEAALLPAVDERWVGALVPLVLLTALVTLSLWRPQWSWYRTAPRLTWLPRAQTQDLWIVAVLVFGAFLVAYPVAASLVGQESLEVAAAVNAAYLLAVCCGVAFGADRMVDWVGRKLMIDHRGMLRDLSNGLPLLVVFATFFLFTTELWQAADGMPNWAFLVLIVAVLGITFLPLALLALADLTKHRVFESWEAVGKAALRIENEEKAGVLECLENSERSTTDRIRPQKVSGMDDVVALLEAAKGRFGRQQRLHNAKELEVTLSRRQRLNIVGVVGLYQALFFVPLFAGAFAVLLGVGLLAVPNELLDNWINGDQPAGSTRNPEDFRQGSFFAWPWTKVAFFLAAFSILYISVDVLRSPDVRKRFFAPADEGVRQRLAVKKVYEAEVPNWKATATKEPHQSDRPRRRRFESPSLRKQTAGKRGR